MNVTYKSHDITATAWQVLELKQQWKPTVLICGPGVGSFREERYILDVPFFTEAEAETAGIEWAKKLIDERAES